jgi:hypothetical protein
MRPVIEKYLPEIEQLEKIKKTLKQVKEEWLETKPGKGNNKYIGVNTVRQILDHAVAGITYWDFGTTEQWREEVYKLDKQTNQWVFDGYVYHVKGYLFIPGLGHREQYGCKVAIGGKDNQDSAYKSAASNCLVKCASLFGVGEDVYSKIKIDLDDDDQYQQLQQDPNYMMQQQQQNWNQQQGYSYQQGWGQPSPQGFDQQPMNPMPQQWQQNWNQQQQGWNQQQQPWGGQQQPANFNQAPGFDPNGDDLPFNPFEPGTPEAHAWDQRNLTQKQQAPQAQEQPFTAQPQGQAQPQGYQASAQPVQYGAPVNATQPQQTTQQEAQQPSAVPAQWDLKEMQRTHMHKARLGLQTDEQLNQYIRDFLKKDTATIHDLKPENLKAFNDYLEKFTA